MLFAPACSSAPRACFLVAHCSGADRKLALCGPVCQHLTYKAVAMDVVDLANSNTETLMSLQIRASRVAVAAVSGVLECQDCGEPIPLKRRQACPGAVRCVDCQRDFETLALKGGDDE